MLQQATTFILVLEFRTPCEYLVPGFLLLPSLSLSLSLIAQPSSPTLAARLGSTADDHDAADDAAPRREKPIEAPTRTSLRILNRCYAVTANNSLLQGSLPEDDTETKKPRRSDRLSKPDKTPVSHKQHLPSPVTNTVTDDSAGRSKEPTPTRKDFADKPDQPVTTPRKTDEPHEISQALSSPPQDTQPLSQFVDHHPAAVDEVEDEIQEGVWGYLVPLDPKYGDKPLVLKRRSACPMPDKVEASADKDGNDKSKSSALRDEEAYERTKIKGTASGGYLIGRHPECGKLQMTHIHARGFSV